MVYSPGHFDRKRHHAGDKFRLSRFKGRERVTVGGGLRGRKMEEKSGLEMNEKPVKAGEPGHF